MHEATEWPCASREPIRYTAKYSRTQLKWMTISIPDLKLREDTVRRLGDGEVTLTNSSPFR